jgi:hypothetical protein
MQLNKKGNEKFDFFSEKLCQGNSFACHLLVTCLSLAFIIPIIMFSEISRANILHAPVRGVEMRVSNAETWRLLPSWKQTQVGCAQASFSKVGMGAAGVKLTDSYMEAVREKKYVGSVWDHFWSGEWTEE